MPNCDENTETRRELNEKIETDLVKLEPALEQVHAEMLQLQDDLGNGKFDVQKLLERVLAVLRTH